MKRPLVVADAIWWLAEERLTRITRIARTIATETASIAVDLFIMLLFVAVWIAILSSFGLMVGWSLL